MRKRMVLGFLVLGIGMASTSCNQMKEVREFDFYNSIIFQNGDSKEVYLNAIINTEGYDLESMLDKVKEEYFVLNGRADKLTLRVYKSVESLKSGDCIEEKIYLD